VVYVAKTYPEWKISVLKLLRDRNAAGKLPLVSQDDMKSDETAKAQWKDIMAALMADASLKPFGKHLGPFAAFKREEASVLGGSALEANLPFDELALLKENVEYLKDKIKMEVKIALAEEPLDASHADAAGQAQPGKPAIHYIIAAGSAPAGGGKAGGGGKAKAAPAKDTAAAAAKAKPKPAGNTIADVGKLNEHLSTRSYMDGGCQPSSLDAAQLGVVPAKVDAEKHTHVDRWYKHISFFNPTQRASW